MSLALSHEAAAPRPFPAARPGRPVVPVRSAPPDVTSFEEQGFLLLPGVFALEEMGWLCNEAAILGLRASEAEDGAGDTGFLAAGIPNAHMAEPGFRNLAHHPRLLGPARRLLGGDPSISETRLWPGGTRRPLAARRMRRGHVAPAALVGLVFLDDQIGTASGLSLEAGSHRNERGQVVRIVPRRGTVLFLDGRLACGLTDRSDGNWPAAFLVMLEAARCRQANACPPLGSADASLWPPPYCVAG